MEKNFKQIRKTGKIDIIKIALCGPESTGKTTLASQLAEHFQTAWVPEFARNYLQNKWDIKEQVCDDSDMLPIAYGQIQLENEYLLTANTYLFCDTSLLVTKVFSDVYYGFCDPILDKAAKKHEYDLFFLTDIDVPWQKDDLRDKPDGRDAVFEAFKNVLLSNNKPFITLSGNKEERLKKAVQIVNDLEKAKSYGLSSHDFVQIFNYGIPIPTILKQLKIFKNGIPKMILVKPAKVSHGILKLTENDFHSRAAFFDANKSAFNLEKFVPASGAASRMFKFLSEFVNDFDLENETINGYTNRKKDSELPVFIIGANKFPFFSAIYLKLRSVIPNFDALERDYKNYYFIKYMMSSEHFDFANKPKGVLPFHRYPTHTATATEEHLQECVNYSNSNDIANLHFTVSEDHKTLFDTTIKSVKSKIEKQSGMKINYNYSFQKKSTNTIAVDLKNKSLRDEENRLVFRPAGHGALIENLNNLESDLIFIKNIDNVIQNRNDKITLYKKGLAGTLISLQQEIFKFLHEIDTGNKDCVDDIIAFVTNNINESMVDNFSKYTIENKIAYLKNILDRPIRVCGMVKNEGEAGGGPFWVSDSKGYVSLQIVESSQVDMLDQKQAKIFSDATHFNPVDLVCSIKNYKNQKFDLTQFVDNESGFIVEKTLNGKALKSYELPGLWNGAMAKWITVFVEVPLLTFNPVKTVNDLLKSPHQPK